MAEQTQPKKYSKPLPHLDEENRPWWEALQRHELYIQKCGKCGDVRYYPRALCTNCMSSETQWIKCSGRGKVYTFNHHLSETRRRDFASRSPTSSALCPSWTRALKMLTNIIDCAPEQAKIGMPVEVVYEDRHARP